MQREGPVEECGGNKAAAARKLGVSRVTLYRLLSNSPTLWGCISALLEVTG